MELQTHETLNTAVSAHDALGSDEEGRPRQQARCRPHPHMPRADPRPAHPDAFPSPVLRDPCPTPTSEPASRSAPESPLP